MRDASRTVLKAEAYDLSATLMSGQAFRWKRAGSAWEGVIGRRWVRLSEVAKGIHVETAEPVTDWAWAKDYLQSGVRIEEVIQSFPPDPALRDAVARHRGLRLLRQEPWECLASFILSSTKQIVQIEQVVASLSERFGEPLAVVSGTATAYAFPRPEVLAGCSELDLRACKMGFRAPYLRDTALRVAAGEIELDALRGIGREAARLRLMELPGVGKKIADCVLLFAYGYPDAFPVDVWVLRALSELYFGGKDLSLKQAEAFARAHFGPWSGYAQQYLFHYVRLKNSSGRRRGSSLQMASNAGAKSAGAREIH